MKCLVVTSDSVDVDVHVVDKNFRSASAKRGAFTNTRSGTAILEGSSPGAKADAERRLRAQKYQRELTN